MNPDKIVTLLLQWFGANARDLPWRRTRDPYAIWVSEVMLQQTQVKAVVPYWERWMAELPTIGSLARAKPERIHKLWEGLGYYTRVRNMQKAAQFVLRNHGGQFPLKFEHVLELPGIGRYTAGAICSIAFDQPYPVLDGNVVRVLARVFGVDGNPRDKQVNARLWELAERLVKQAGRDSWRSRDGLCGKIANRKSQIANQSCSHLNQSLMELGALVCTPRVPRCAHCPLTKLCVARKQCRVNELPGLTPGPPTTRRRFVAFVISRGAKVLVRQRPTGVVNAHLWEFPNFEVPHQDADPRKSALKLWRVAPVDLRPLCTIRHSITRYRIQLDAFEARFLDSWLRQAKTGTWVHRSRLHRLAFASAHKKIVDRLAKAPEISW
jgi:A/G-specific adenine glycosylase